MSAVISTDSSTAVGPSSWTATLPATSALMVDNMDIRGGVDRGITGGSHAVNVVDNRTYYFPPPHDHIPSGQRLALVSTPLRQPHSAHDEREADAYVRILCAKGVGYPLWRPSPSESPAGHRRNGIKIGDVGKISFSGKFIFLFNIFLNNNNPANLIRNLSMQPLEHLDVGLDSEAYEPGEIIKSRNVAIGSLGGLDNRDGDTQNPSFHFTCHPGEGAILVLPDGASQTDLILPSRMEDYLRRHVSSWYKQLGEREDLVIVTGADKCTTWGNACYTNTTEVMNTSMSDTSIGHHNGSPSSARYSWSPCDPISSRCGRSEGDVANQCIFIRGFKSKLRKRSPKTLFAASVSVSDIVESGTHAPARRISGVGSNSKGSLFQNPFSGNHSEASRDLESHCLDDSVLVDNFPEMNELFHPLDSINSYLLDKNPEAQIAITHDDVWLSVVRKDVTVDLSGEEILRRVLEQYIVVQENACVGVTRKADERIICSGVDQSRISTSSNSACGNEEDGMGTPCLPGTQGGDLYNAPLLASSSVIVGSGHTFHIHHHHRPYGRPDTPDSGPIGHSLPNTPATTATCLSEDDRSHSPPNTPATTVTLLSEEDRSETKLAIPKFMTQAMNNPWPPFRRMRPSTYEGTRNTRLVSRNLFRPSTVPHTRDLSRIAVTTEPISEHNDHPTPVLMSGTQFDRSETDRQSIPISVVNDRRSGSISIPSDEAEPLDESGEDAEAMADLERAITDPAVHTHKDKHGSVLAGTLEGLVERLIWDSNDIRQDAEYRDTFLTTYAAFTNADKVYQSLVRKYQEIERLPMDSQPRIRYNVVVLMKHWVGTPHVLVDMEVLKQMKDFALSLATGQIAELARLVAERIDIQMSAEDSNSQSFPDEQNPPHGPKSVGSKDLANALTVLEGELYRSLLPADYIRHLLQPSLLNNIDTALKTHEHIITWMKMSILTQVEYKGRASVVKFLISTAEACRELGNFASMAAIVTALQSSSISQLLVTMDEVGEGGRRSLKDLSRLLHEIPYNAALSKHRKSCVPWIYIHLNELRAVLRKNKAVVVVDGRPLINFVRSIEITRWIKRMLQYQIPKVRRVQHTETVVYLERQLGDVPLGPSTENYLQQRSKILAQQEEESYRRRTRELEALGLRM